MSLLNDPAHWRMRASDLRRLADASTDSVYRAKLQEIAASYDLLAVRTLARLDTVPDTTHAQRQPAPVRLFWGRTIGIRGLTRRRRYAPWRYIWRTFAE
jgi:hypothetical protein